MCCRWCSMCPQPRCAARASRASSTASDDGAPTAWPLGDGAELRLLAVDGFTAAGPLGVTLPDGAARSYAYSPWAVAFADEEDNRANGAHEGTPTITALDPLGRVYLSVETPDGSSSYQTRLTLDIQGNVRVVIDPRGNEVMAIRSLK